MLLALGFVALVVLLGMRGAGVPKESVPWRAVKGIAWAGIGDAVLVVAVFMAFGFLKGLLGI